MLEFVVRVDFKHSQLPALAPHERSMASACDDSVLQLPLWTAISDQLLLPSRKTICFAVQMNRSWPGWLPDSLTQLVLMPGDGFANEPEAVAPARCAFLQSHLPRLTALRHLALHSARSLRNCDVMPWLATAATSLPHLESLHLVRQ